MKKVIIAILVATTAFTACNKDKKAKDKLTAHTWRITSNTIDGDNVLENCDLDDVITFQDNGVVITDAGAAKCDASDPQTTNGTYTVTETTLVLNDPTSITISYSIQSFDDDRIILTSTLLGSTINTTLEK